MKKYSFLWVIIAFSVSLSPARAEPPDTWKPYLEYLASMAFTGPRIYDCVPGNVDVNIKLGLMLAHFTGHQEVVHGTANKNFDARQMNPASFYGANKHYPKIHALMHGPYPNSLDPNHFVSAANQDPLPNLGLRYFKYPPSELGSPDLLVGYEFWPGRFVNTWTKQDSTHKAIKDAYVEEKAKMTGGQFSKKVPQNVAASRLLASKINDLNWSSQLRGISMQRQFPCTRDGVYTILSGWHGRKTNSVAKNIPYDTMTKALKQNGHHDLTAFYDPANPGTSSLCADGTYKFTYDELVLFKGAQDPGGVVFVRDEDLPDPKTDPDGIAHAVADWQDTCENAANEFPSYSPDYLTWIPFMKPEETLEALTGIRENIETQLRIWNNDLLNRIEAQVKKMDSKNLVTDVLRPLAQKSSVKILTVKEIGSLRVAAYRVLQDVCTKAKQVMNAGNVQGYAAAGIRFEGGSNIQVCDRSYIDMPAAQQVELKWGNQGVVVTADRGKKTTKTNCSWSWKKLSCQPEDKCYYRYKFGDMSFSQACRVSPQVGR